MENDEEVDFLCQLRFMLNMGAKRDAIKDALNQRINELLIRSRKECAKCLKEMKNKS